MSKLRLYGSTSGYNEITVPAVADNSEINIGNFVSNNYLNSGVTTLTDAQGNVRALEVTVVNSTPYTVASGSSGKYFGLGTGSSVVTINDSNFAAGDIITIYNRLSTDATINFSGFTLAHIAGDATNKTSMTLAGYGLCTMIYDRSSYMIVNGNVS